MSTEPEAIFWERECAPASNWKTKLPHLWQLHSEFNIQVIQRLKQASLAGATDYLLASKTSCSNGFRTISSLCYLSPTFGTLGELEHYLSEHIVDLLHTHFFGQMAPDTQFNLRTKI